MSDRMWHAEGETITNIGHAFLHRLEITVNVNRKNEEIVSAEEIDSNSPLLRLLVR